MDPEHLAQRMDKVLERLEAAPEHPFSQEEIDDLRVALTTFRRIVERLETLGWFGKWALWILGTVVLVLSQWEELRQRIWP